MSRFKRPGHFATIDEFNAYLRELDPTVQGDAELSGRDGPLGSSPDIDGLRIGNRFAIHPMEGWDGAPDGMPGEHTLRRWRRFGRSGAKLIWGGEAFAVQHDGRANPNQLFLNPNADTARGLSSLRSEIIEGHRSIGESTDDLVIGLQLTHSGRFARPDSSGSAPRIAHRHPVLARMYALPDPTPLLTDNELEAIAENFVRAAVLAEQTGFDFVDIKCCHGYLLHELLAAHTREGRYGGSFENRTRLFRTIVDGVRSATQSIRIGVRVSITDTVPFIRSESSGIGMPASAQTPPPYRFGFGVDANDPLQFDFDEPLQFLELLRALDIRLVNLTIGSPYYCPHLQRPAMYPPSDGYEPPEDPLRSVIRHLQVVRRCKRAFPDLLFVGSGYTYLQEFLPHVAQAEVGAGNVDVVGVGRMVLSYPELPRDVLARNPLQRKCICRTFSECTTAPRNGLISGCYPLDNHYKQMPHAAELKAIKRAMRTRTDSQN